jgi:hypothetical protein
VYAEPVISHKYIPLDYPIRVVEPSPAFKAVLVHAEHVVAADL